MKKVILTHSRIYVFVALPYNGLPWYDQNLSLQYSSACALVWCTLLALAVTTNVLNTFKCFRDSYTYPHRTMPLNKMAETLKSKEAACFLVCCSNAFVVCVCVVFFARDVHMHTCVYIPMHIYTRMCACVWCLPSNVTYVRNTWANICLSNSFSLQDNVYACSWFSREFIQSSIFISRSDPKQQFKGWIMDSKISFNSTLMIEDPLNVSSGWFFVLFCVSYSSDMYQVFLNTFGILINFTIFLLSRWPNVNCTTDFSNTAKLYSSIDTMKYKITVFNMDSVSK